MDEYEKKRARDLKTMEDDELSAYLTYQSMQMGKLSVCFEEVDAIMKEIKRRGVLKE